jgi:prolipoprotein diacylglyceryltransferase
LGLYLALSGVGRFIVGFYRPNHRIIAQFTAPQVLALTGILFGFYFIFLENQSVNSLSGITEELH